MPCGDDAARFILRRQEISAASMVVHKNKTAMAQLVKPSA